MRLHLTGVSGTLAVSVVLFLAPLGARPSRVPSRVPSPARGHRGTVQGSVVGRYVLRSVNGLQLPATIPGDDPRHTLQVTDGVLELNADGTYLCRTVATTTDMGLPEAFADTLQGGYTILQAGAIQFAHKGVKPDTVVTSGFQIRWAHPVRTAQAVFLYSR